MAKATSAETIGVKSMKPIKAKCIVCGVSYDANEIILDGKPTGKITPPRCPKHQTQHLTNVRVNKTIKDIRLVGNLTSRLRPEQRQAVLDAITDVVAVVADRFNNVADTKEQGFNLDI